MKKFVTYWFYPILLFTTIATFIVTIQNNWNLKIVFAWMGGLRFLILILIEFLFPLKTEWKMTKKSFVRDLKWMAVGALIFGLIQFGVQILAIDISHSNKGIIANSSILTGAVLSLIIYEFFQYWYHRLSHTGTGKFRKWLWRVHLIHHLPKKVYLLMHPVFHPINMIFMQIIIQGSLILLGAKAESIFIFNAIMGLQGLISHFNVDIKAGWLNYIFIGTELHRYHHSANIREAQNYGSVISIWDLIFGTFYYKPGQSPKQLGIKEEGQYPKSTELLKALSIPFKKIE